MGRGSSEILPLCPYCGQYKGIGECKNPNCSGKGSSHSMDNRSTKCVICSSEGVVSCSVCKQTYCEKHSKGINETKMIAIDQHIGTCVICGKFVCEQCWIFNNEGKITCLIHTDRRNGKITNNNGN